MSDGQPVRRTAGFPAPPPVIWVLALGLVGTELVLSLSDEGILPWPDLRLHAFLTFGFLDLYFEAMLAGESVPLTFWSSFVTYAFLHGGMFHLVMNGVIFLALGGLLANVLGTVRFLIFFAVTAAAGALALALISDTNAPLVGASGVVFGLFGAFKRWEWRHIRKTGAAANRFWGTIGALTLINVILYFAYPGGTIAWEAHLGGFVAGYALAGILAPRLAMPSPI